MPFRAGTEQKLLGRSIQQPKCGDQREVTRLRVFASAFLWPATTAGAFTTCEVHHQHSLTFAVTSGYFPFIAIALEPRAGTLLFHFIYSVWHNCYNSLELWYRSSLA